MGTKGNFRGGSTRWGGLALRLDTPGSSSRSQKHGCPRLGPDEVFELPKGDARHDQHAALKPVNRDEQRADLLILLGTHGDQVPAEDLPRTNLGGLVPSRMFLQRFRTGPSVGPIPAPTTLCATVLGLRFPRLPC